MFRIRKVNAHYNKIEVGFTEHQKISPSWVGGIGSHCGPWIPLDEEKWDNVIACRNDDGTIRGDVKDVRDYDVRDYALSSWSKRNDYLNICKMPNCIKFEVITESDEGKKKEEDGEEDEEEEYIRQLKEHSQLEVFTWLPIVYSKKS